MAVPCGDDAEVNTPVRGAVSLVGAAARRCFGGEGQDLHRGVVVVDDLALGGVPEELVPDGDERRQGVTDELPLGRGRQRNAHPPLQDLDAMERQATAVLEQADHTRGRGVVLRVAHARRRRGGEHLAAQIAAPALARVDGGAQRGHPGDPHQRRGLGERIDLALGTPGAAVAATQRGVRDRHPVGAGVGGGAEAAVARRRRGRRGRSGLGPGGRPRSRGAGPADDRPGLPVVGPEEAGAAAGRRRLRSSRARP